MEQEHEDMKDSEIPPEIADAPLLGPAGPYAGRNEVIEPSWVREWFEKHIQLDIST